MKKLKILFLFLVVLMFLIVLVTYSNRNEKIINQAQKELIPIKKERKKKTMKDRRRFAEERWKHEFNFQVNPKTGEIPKEEKNKEIIMSNNMMIQAKNSKASSNASYISRGPSNLGGRTRSLVIDRSDNMSNTIIAGGVSSGVFRTTDGGASWTKVSANNEIHNVTTIVQDPRTGFENIWYYGTGESQGNSASASGAAFLGQGIWQSIDGGLNWAQLPSTASDQTSIDSPFDFMYKIAVHPITGNLYAGAGGAIRRFDGTTWTVELDSGGNFFSDLVITSTGIVYAAFSGNSPTANGVWQSPTGIGSYTRIGSNTTPGFQSSGRIVLAVAQSNEDILYALHVRNNLVAGGLWQWNNSGSGSWTDYTSKVPDLPGGDLDVVDPFTSQGGYDLVVNVKPDDPNFVVIGGTNAYRVLDITTEDFELIGGYRFDTSDGVSNADFALYDFGVGADQHHPDIHALEFDPNNPDILFSGTDGGIHRTDVTTATVGWTSLNNNYQTYQYYHVATDPEASSNIVIGGAQDNGTTAGGFASSPDLTTMSTQAGGDGVAVAVSRDNACVPFFLGFQNGPIFRDCPNGGEITPDGSSSQFVTYFYLDPSNNNALYYAGQDTLYRTNESSEVTSSTWTDLGALRTGENIRQMATSWGAYDSSQSYLLIGLSTGSLFKLNDPQNRTLSSLRDISPPGFSGTVSGIAVHPNNNDIAMVTYSNYGVTNIYVTTNATSNSPTWTVVERNLDVFSIRSAAITDVDNETRYFVGTARGLYSTTDPVNIDWEIEAPNQIGFAVVSALAYKPSNNKLLVGTHGNGMYEGTVVSTALSVDDFDASESSFVAWPIPANDVLNVVLENSFVTGDIDYNLYSIDGKNVKTGVLKSDKQINVSDLAQGNYILQLSSASKKKAIVFNKR